MLLPTLFGVLLMAVDSGGGSLASARQSLERGHLETAEQQIGQVLSSDPRSGAAYDLLGRLRLRQRRLPEAEAAFSKAASLTPSADIQENLMLVQLFAGRSAAAEDSARALLRLEPRSFNARLALGLLAFERSRYRESLSALGALGAVQDPLVLALRSESFRKLGRDAEAARTKALLSSRQVPAQDAFLAARIFRAPELKAYPIAWLSAAASTSASPAILLPLGELYASLRNWKEALACYERAIAAAPDDVHLRIRAAEAAEELGQHDTTRKHMAEAGRAAKGDAAKQVEFGAACIHLHFMLAARDALSEAIGLRPGNAAAHFHLAVVSAYLGERKFAEEHYRTALELEPGNARFRVGFGHFLLENARAEEARQQLEMAASSPDMAGHALHYLGRIQWNIDGDTDKARETLEKAARLIPEDAETYADLAGVAITQGDLAGARAYIARALRLDDRCSQAHSQNGRLLAKTGRLKEAKEEMRKAEKLRSDERDRVAVLAAN